MGALPASAAALLAAAALVLSGCGDDTPPPAPSSSAAPTSASPTTQPPSPQPESAEEFIRRWAEAGTEMQNSGKTGVFKSLTRMRALQQTRRARDQASTRTEDSWRPTAGEF